MKNRLLILIIACTALALINLPHAAAAQTPPPPFKLTIMHTNDTRAHYLPSSDGSGGVTREATVVKQIRAEVLNTLLLDVGGRFTGTLFHKIYKGQDNAQVMNLLGYQGMTLSNTEFDNGDAVLAQFIDAIKFPVVAANISVERSQVLNGKILPSTVLTVADQQIGLIGLAPVETTRLSSPSKDLSFSGGYAAVVQREVARLTGLGVNKIILLSQLGLDADKKLVPQISGVDVVMGGNSRSLLSNTYTTTDGPYPVIVADHDKQKVLIVQAGGGDARFMGRLDLEFNDKGVITKSGGDTILLSKYITPDPDMDALVKDLAVEVTKLQTSPIKALAGGDASASADIAYDSKLCRKTECAIGNLIADAMRAEAGTQIALMNGGGFRSGIAAGPISVGQVFEVLPYGNLLATFKLDGASLLATLENGLSRLGADSGTGRFMQVSGMRYSYDPNAPAGHRVLKAEVLGDDGSTYTALDPAVSYTVVANDFMRRGGDDNTVLRDKATESYDFGRALDEALLDYIAAHSPIAPVIEGRIVVNASAATPAAATPAS